jgi:hypothetical protein
VWLVGVYDRRPNLDGAALLFSQQLRSGQFGGARLCQPISPLIHTVRKLNGASLHPNNSGVTFSLFSVSFNAASLAQPVLS